MLHEWFDWVAGRSPFDAERSAAVVAILTGGWILIWRRAVRWTRPVCIWTGGAATLFAISAIGVAAWFPNSACTDTGAWLGTAIWIAATGVIWSGRAAQGVELAERFETAVRCPKCGTDLVEARVMDCPSCGAALDLSDLVARALLDRFSQRQTRGAIVRPSRAAD